MNISELSSLTEWIQTEIVEGQIPENYQQLQTILQQNVEPNQQSTSFETQKDELLTVLRSIHTTSLSNDQVTLLSKLGIEALIGKAGVDAIEDVLYRNSIDIATAAQKIAERTQAINEGIRKSAQIAEGLSGLVESDEDDVADGVLIRVSFLGEAAMNNIADFKKWGDIWYNIGRGVAQAHGDAPEDIRIVGAAKGSVIIELLANSVIAETVSGIILRALTVAEKVFNLRKIAAETRVLKLQEKKLAGVINKAAEDEKNAGIATIIKEQTKLLKLKPETDGEKIVALEKSITELVTFISDGGGVDFVAPEEKTDDDDEVIDDDFVQIRQQAEGIRNLEDRLKLLEDNREEVEDE